MANISAQDVPAAAGLEQEIERNPSTGGVDRHYSVPGGVFHNPAGAYAREMAKWEMGWSPFGPPGRPRERVGHQSYPCRMYRVKRAATGGDVEVVHSADAASEAEERNYRSRGYYNGLAEAAKALAQSEQEAAVLAAERAANERRMSDAARAEAAAADDAHDGHLASVPETPIVRRVRRE
jgi:hypothetical protein